MTIEKLNRILLIVILASLFIFFAFLNLKYARKYPDLYSPTEVIEVYTPSELQTLPEEIIPTSTY